MSRLLCAILLAAASLSASPIFQVTYSNGTAANDGRYIIGLTQITLEGSGPAQTFDSMCFDFLHEIGSGQTYLGEAVKLTTYASNPDDQTKYDMAGFTYLAMHEPNLSGITAMLGGGLTNWDVLQGLQFGVWDLMDPDEQADGNIYGPYVYASQVDDAVGWALANPVQLAQIDLGLQNQFHGALDNLYVVQGIGRDAGLQKFIIGGDIPAGVPEPGSMCLMGGGLLGLAAILRRRATR